VVTHERSLSGLFNRTIELADGVIVRRTGAKC